MGGVAKILGVSSKRKMKGAEPLTPRWFPLKPHPVQRDLCQSHARFRVVVAGRRSGKTERAKRFLVLAAMSAKPGIWHPRYVAAAPTHDQARRIYWDDLKSLVPEWALAHPPWESPPRILLNNGAEIMVAGLDEPKRIEGSPLDGIILDEYADMKPRTWEQSVRPALSTLGRPGWAWFVGKPRGRNHFYELAQKAQNDTQGTYGYFHWDAEDILDPEEIAEAKLDLDPQTYDQEYRANFVNFEGRVYYMFDQTKHCEGNLPYNPEAELILCFDFNVSPGVAVVCQEVPKYQGGKTKVCRDGFTAVIGEVWKENSNSRVIASQLAETWGKHQGQVVLDGDASGGARTTQGVSGTDWEIIKGILKPVFGDRLLARYPRGNPLVRQRINAVNSRIESVDGTIKTLIDPARAPHLIRDLEGVSWKQGGDGEIEKTKDSKLTHISDAFGYYVARRWPLRMGWAGAEQLG